MFFSTKSYGPERGLSCAFRQSNATHSHCNLIHGYALGFTFKFGCKSLDDKNWVVDFGGLKPLKQWLEDTFDHTLAIDSSDPHLDTFKDLEKIGLVDLRILKGVGCEMFAKHAYTAADKIITDLGLNERCWVEEVECREHGANSAIYCGTTIFREEL